jgi:hypothetical protein
MIHCIQCGGIMSIDEYHNCIYTFGENRGKLIYRTFCKDCRAIHEVIISVIGEATWFKKPVPMNP